MKLTEVGRQHIHRRMTLEPDGLREPGPFKVVVGSIASGAPVVQDPTIFERLSDTAAMRKATACSCTSPMSRPARGAAHEGDRKNMLA